MTDLSHSPFSGYWRVAAPDVDPAETREWLDAFDALVRLVGLEPQAHRERRERAGRGRGGVVVGGAHEGLPSRVEAIPSPACIPRSVIPARSPDQEDNSALPRAQALKAQFTVAFAIVFHRDHRVVEHGLQVSKIYLVLPEVLPSLRLAPSDHRQTVYAFCGPVNQTVDAK